LLNFILGFLNLSVGVDIMPLKASPPFALYFLKSWTYQGSRCFSCYSGSYIHSTCYRALKYYVLCWGLLLGLNSSDRHIFKYWRCLYCNRTARGDSCYM